MVSRNSTTTKEFNELRPVSCRWESRIAHHALTDVHTLPAFVVRDEDRWYIQHIHVDERFEAIGDRIVRMEDVVKFRTSGQNKILA